jgi:site-specific DNA recombinase
MIISTASFLFFIDFKAHTTLKKEFSFNFIQVEKMTRNSLNTHKRYLTRIKNNIELIEQRFLIGEIKENLYNKYLVKFQKESEEIESEIEKIKAGLVPKTDIKQETERIMNDLSGVWMSGNLRNKRLIQTLIFPEGIFYDKAMDKILVKALTPGFYLSK